MKINLTAGLSPIIPWLLLCSLYTTRAKPLLVTSIRIITIMYTVASKNKFVLKVVTIYLRYFVFVYKCLCLIQFIIISDVK